MSAPFSCLSQHAFTEWLAEQIRFGFNLVPFIGSGFSAASGIITAQEFQNLLAWTVFRCVAPVTEQGDNPRLDLRMKGWPAPPHAAEIALAKSWIAKVFERSCLSCGLRVAFCEDRTTVQVLFPGPAGGPTQIEAALRRPLVPAVLRTEATQVDDSDVLGLLRSLNRLDVLRDFAPSPDVSATSDAFIQECAIRSLHDWRSTLHFLARLNLVQTSECPGGRIWLASVEEVDNRVIDGFNRSIIGSREPNLAHIMLCHLAARSRIRAILTTNFDDLIEQTFERLGESFAKISVHLNDPLPDPNLVNERNVILKLHGDLTQTRADYSLDSAPTGEDKRRFFNYVRGRDPLGPPENGGYLPGLLFVCGYSGSDLRWIQMIKYLLDMDEQALVVWVCHTQSGLAALRRLFHDQGYLVAEGKADLPRSGGNAGPRRARIVATVSDRADLLLYELYQRLTLSMPRGGFNHQFNHDVPPGRGFIPGDTGEVRGEYAQRLIDALWQERKPNGKVVVADGPSGLTAPLRQAFHGILRDRRCKGLWLELDNYSNPNTLAHHIFALISVNLGRFNLGRDELSPEFSERGNMLTKWKEWFEKLLRNWNVDPSEWLIVLYGRNGAGGCAAWGDKYWSQDDYADFDTLLSALRGCCLREDSRLDRDGPNAQRGNGGFMILYAPYSEVRKRRDLDKLDELNEVIEDIRCVPPPSKTGLGQKDVATLEAENFERSIAWRYAVRDQVNAHICKYSAESIYRAPLFLPDPPDPTFQDNMRYAANDWLLPIELRDRDEQGSERDREPEAVWARRFLYAISLFRQQRHFSAMLSEGAYPCPEPFNLQGVDNDWHRFSCVFRWLIKLNQRGHLIFRKPASFAWVYRDSRLGIQQLVHALRPSTFAGRLDFAGQARARIHYWIGDWYSRAYRACGHVLPLLEALYHFRECIVFARWAKPRGINKPEIYPEYRRRLARRAIFELIKLIRHGRDGAIKYWMQDAAGDPWFSLNEGGGGRLLLEQLEEAFRALAPSTQPAADSVPLRSSFLWEEWLGDLEQELHRLPQSSPVGTSAQLSEFRIQRRLAVSAPARTAIPPPNFSRRDVSQPDGEPWRRLLLEEILPALPEIFRHQSSGPDLDRGGWETLLGFIGNDEGHGGAQDEQRLYDNLCQWRHDWIPKLEGDSGRIEAAARTIFELAYLHVRRAKLAQHAEEPGNQIHLGSESTRKLWVKVCGLAWLVLDFCAELPPSELTVDLELRIAANTIYGLALGRLGRFFEAHRRLNEAHASLFSLNHGAHGDTELCKIKLRRAEIHLLEERLLKGIFLAVRKWRDNPTSNIVQDDAVKENGGKHRGFFEKILDKEQRSPDAVDQWVKVYLPAVSLNDSDCATAALRELNRQRLAKLDDAWLSLDTAQQCMNSTHSALWWGRLFSMRLQVYAESTLDAEEKITILAFRKRGDPIEEIKRLVTLGESASHHSPYTAIRLLDYAAQAVAALELQRPECRSDARKCLESVQVKLENLKEKSKLERKLVGLIERYFELVERSVRREVKRHKEEAHPAVAGD